MKTMTCKQLGGACEKAFTADTFDEIVNQSKAHGAEMFQNMDINHLEAMKAVQEIMMEPEKMQAWFDEKRQAFEALPEDKTPQKD